MTYKYFLSQAGTAVAIVLLATACKGAGAASAPASDPSAAPDATATPQSCQSWAASHTFAQVYDSLFHKDGSLGLYLHPATVSCGGPDDMHYDVSAKTVTATVVPSGTVQMLVTTPNGPADRSVSRKVDLDVLLGQDHWGRIFMVTGPLTAITALKEMYHP